ncbi:hypothetical protein PENSTE_c010G09652 [Penicillium steckii]|uniref:Phenylacetaldoxime dehydratase n=1 Tax=Penicillium steckii TaxID=303698 RepID=A0A1V6T8C6_9EURO|nr:hypothetical protein PENSTE_c010G09652 [Penicillium steckii]
MVSESDTRTYPLRQPPNHNPPPRLHLVFPEGQKQVFTAYIGIQLHQKTTLKDALLQLSDPRHKVQEFLASSHSVSTEQFIMLNDALNHTQPPTQRQAETPFSNPTTKLNHTSVIWACYWNNKQSYEKALARLNLFSIYNSLPQPLRPITGLWIESFISEIARLETVYSATDYMPGLARLPGTSTAQHIHTGYWGAARDRIPGSGEDLFTGESSTSNDNDKRYKNSKQEDGQDDTTSLSSLGFSIKGTNPSDIVHIRSGQFWKNCLDKESSAYLENIEPKLRNGLSYLWDNSLESGSFGVRYLQNTHLDLDSQDDTDKTGTKTKTTTENSDSISKYLNYSPKESCVTAYFKNMTDLERWSSKHPSHLAIHAAAISHARRFGDTRKFRTWHEVSVIRGGEASFQYVNCLYGTGVERGMISIQRTSV